MERNNYDTAKKFSMTYNENDPYIHIDESRLLLLSDQQKGVVVSKDTGTHISGELNMKAKPENIMVAQMYKFNNMMMSLLPSTIYTPIPAFKQGYTDKVKQFGEISSHTSELMGMLGSM